MHGWSKAIREGEMEILYAFEVMSTVALICVVFIFVHVYSSMIMKSGRIRRKLKMQGIKGPPPSFLYGNLPEMQKIQLQITKSPTSHHPNFIAHDYTATLFPYLEHWRKQYGKIYTYTTGTGQHLYVNEAEVVKEMNQSMSLDLGKPSYVTRRLAPMLGNGIIRSNGLTWAHQRKIVAPEFYMDKVKGMMGLMAESVKPMLRKWEESIECQGGMTAEIKVDEDLREVSADVISRACFGSSSFRGKHIFSKLRRLQKLISNQSILFEATHLGYFSSLASLISQYLPLKKQNEIENLEAEIESLIWETVRERERECQETCTPEKDLMQYILEGAINDKSLSRDSSKNFIVDNCKSIYFAGHESTAVAASWCLVLLALHPEWQARIRAELAQVCQDVSPTAIGSFLNLKTVTMVIQETLRLYPPAAFVSREALEETRIGNIVVPKGVCIWTLIPTLHRDPEIWGPDANEFKPERFSEGVIKACKFPQAYIPFGVGLRLCLGKNFAMVQLKVVLALIVSKFTFSLSPKYQHSPAYRMIVEPGHGVHILVQKIK